MLNLSTAREYPFKIDPLALYVYPDIEQNVNTVEFFLPGRSILLENLWRSANGQMLTEASAYLYSKGRAS
jgi:hypothetical protein